MDNIQPFLGNDYKSALTAVKKITNSPPVGYKKPTSEVDPVHTVLIGQNNTIIAPLEEVSRILNHLIDSTKGTNLSKDIDGLIKQVSKLSLEHTLIQKQLLKIHRNLSKSQLKKIQKLQVPTQHLPQTMMIVYNDDTTQYGYTNTN